MSGQSPSAGPPSPIQDGRSPVAGGPRRELSIGTKLGFVGLLGVLALGFIWFNALYSHKKANSQQSTPTAYTNGGEQFMAPPAAAPKSEPVAIPMPAAAPQAASAFGMSNQQSPATAPIMAFSGAETVAAPAPQPSSQPVSASAPDEGAGNGSLAGLGQDNSPLAMRLKPTVLDGEKASVIQNPDMVITEGTVIPCTMQTAINSELPGLVTCVVPIDIRGSTGNVVLLDAGTKIVGQLQNGLLQGQNRVFVDWTRAETPDHVIVTLDSPGTDELGRGGLPGAVDNHFWERFGGALMLTLVQGGLDAATIEAAGNGNNNSTSNEAALGFVYAAQSNGQSVANTALQNTINIPPTLTKNQGDTVALIVAHDLDFSDVYRLQINNVGLGDGNGG